MKKRDEVTHKYSDGTVVLNEYLKDANIPPPVRWRCMLDHNGTIHVHVKNSKKKEMENRFEVISERVREKRRKYKEEKYYESKIERQAFACTFITACRKPVIGRCSGNRYVLFN